MVPATDLPWRDWGAIVAIAATAVAAMGAISRWSNRGLAKQVGELMVSVEERGKANTQRWDDHEKTLERRFGDLKAGILESSGYSREATAKASEAAAYALKGAEFATLEFENNRQTLVDIGDTLKHELEKIKADRIVPLEAIVKDLREHGCGLARMKSGSGNGDPKPVGCE